MTKAKFIKLIIATVLAIAALFVPYEALGFVGDNALNPLEIRVIAIFVMAALYWILQPFPIWSTSMLVIVLMILTLSNSALMPFRVEGVEPLKFKAIMATFANPINMLFLGGFFLAAAACKYNMDKNLARVLLKPFGRDPKWVLLGLMIITAVFSMFMSNTATAAMMLAILGPVLKLFDESDRGKAAFALAIPLGANIGGMGTPIGTPPNAIALNFMRESGFDISFGQWMTFGVPYVIVLMVIAWILLLKLYPIKMKEMVLKIDGAEGFDKSPRAIIVYITFAVCVFLWVSSQWLHHGIDDNVIAMIPMAVFALTGVITKKDLNAMSWDVLWLVAGGFALGLGLQGTGLAKHLIATIPFNTWSPLALRIGCGFICLFMANFMSHTSTASLLVPIFIVVAVSCQENLAPLGGVTSLMVAVAFASSLGMCLPISTPPNALAHATGYTDTRGMAITGIVMGIGGLVLSWVMMFGLSKVNFFHDPVAVTAAPAAAEAPAPAPAPAPEAPVAVAVDSAAVDSVVADSAAADSTVADSAVVDSAAAQADSAATPVDSAAIADSIAAKAAADSAAAAQAAADSAAAAKAAADSIEKVKAAEAAAALVAAAEAKKAEEAQKKAEAEEAKKKAAEEKKAAAAAKKAQQDSIAAVKKAKADSVAAAKKAAAEAKKAEAAKKKAEAEEAKKKAAEEKKAAAAAKKAEAEKKKAEAAEAKKKAAEEKKAAAAAKKAQQDSIAAVKKAKADSVAAA